MKSINQIFKKNPELLNDEEVKELIEYCRELESEIFDNKYVKNFSFEDKLAQLVRELNSSIHELIKEDEEAIRFGEFSRVNYEDAIMNLKDYILKFSKNNNFIL